MFHSRARVFNGLTQVLLYNPSRQVISPDTKGIASVKTMVREAITGISALSHRDAVMLQQTKVLLPSCCRLNNPWLTIGSGLH